MAVLKKYENPITGFALIVGCGLLLFMQFGDMNNSSFYSWGPILLAGCFGLLFGRFVVAPLTKMLSGKVPKQ